MALEKQTKNMDALSCLRTRRSIRRYTEEPVTDEELRTLLDAAFCAPSACNFRPCDFVVVRSQQTREALADASVYAKMLPNAPLLLVVCGDTQKQALRELLVNDVSAAVENILLAAHAIGLGAVWLGVHIGEGWYDALRSELNLPEHVLPLAGIAIGHPAETRTIPERYVESRVHQERWS